MGIYDEIVPNVCFINSICSSMVYDLLSMDPSFDYIFYNGEEGISFIKLILNRDEGCIVCALTNY